MTRKYERLRTLDPTHYATVRPLLEDLLRFNVSIAGVLAQNNPGTVYVDHPDAPHVVLLMGPEGTYLAGDASSTAPRAALKNLVHDLMACDGIEALWLTCDRAWQSCLDDLLSRSPLPVARRHYVCTAPAFDWRTHLPPGFAVQRIDQALFARVDVSLPDHVHEWIENNWGTRANFLARGFGFVTTALDTHQVVSWSLADCTGDQACEIGIHTHPAYRRQGFATLTAAAAVDYAFAQGLTVVGWHCNRDNVGSQRTAQRVGFILERDYVSYAAFRREAVHWAEAGRLQEAAGDYRAAAEHYTRAAACGDMPAWGCYIPFHAARAYAGLGDYDTAWTWLNRAVDQGFNDVDALQSAAALRPLHGTPAWKSLLQAIG